jgi:hypothetical protein
MNTTTWIIIIFLAYVFLTKAPGEDYVDAIKSSFNDIFNWVKDIFNKEEPSPSSAILGKPDCESDEQCINTFGEGNCNLDTGECEM